MSPDRISEERPREIPVISWSPVITLACKSKREREREREREWQDRAETRGRVDQTAAERKAGRKAEDDEEVGGRSEER